MDILKDIKLVVFDFDGTLAHLEIDWENLKRALGIEASALKLGDVIQEYVTLNHKNLEVVTAAEVAGLKGAKVQQLVIDVIASLLVSGYKVAVFTRNSRKVVETAFAETPLADKLMIVGREDVMLLKPHSEGLDKIMGEYACLPKQTLLIGDTYHDIEAAQEAGVQAAIVYNPNNQYSPQGADYYLQSLDELVINKT